MPRLTIAKALKAVKQAQGFSAGLELIDEPPTTWPPEYEHIIGGILHRMSPTLQTQIEFCRLAWDEDIRDHHHFPEAQEIVTLVKFKGVSEMPQKSLTPFYRYVEQHKLLEYSLTFANYWNGRMREKTLEFYEILADIYEGLDCNSGPCYIGIRLPAPLLARLRGTRLRLEFDAHVLTYEEMLYEKYVDADDFQTWVHMCKSAHRIFVLVVACCDGIFCIMPQIVLSWRSACGNSAIFGSILSARFESFFRTVTRLPMELQMRVIAMLLPTTKSPVWGWPRQYFNVQDADLEWLCD